MSNNKSDVRFIQFNNYVKPKIKENTYKNWVTNGKNNEFYQYIIDRNNGSPTNNSVNTTYAELIYGQGLCIEGLDMDSKEVRELNKYISQEDAKAVCQDFQLFRELSLQVIKDGYSKLNSISHVAKNLVIPSVEDDNGNITSYWFSRDWAKQHNTRNIPMNYPAFGLGEKGETEIYVGKPYVSGAEYFPNPDYMSGLQYCEIEEEISNFCLNHIKNGFSLGTIVNVPNSYDWSDERKDEYAKTIKGNSTGSSNANGLVISFNGFDSEATTIQDIQNKTLQNQWDSLRDNARQQILTSHRCTSPSIVGVISSTGFSNTAEEMDESRSQLMQYVIKPKQDFIIRCFKDILLTFGIDKDIYFKPLVDPEEEEDKEVKVEDTIKLSETCGCEKKKSELDSFIELGEIVDDNEFDLIDEIEVDYNEELELESKLEFVSTGVARPNAKSSQDGDDYIVRYKYTGSLRDNTREFCKAMMTANKVYRKEDILQLDNKVVNAGWGAHGANTYSIWLYKGGGDCHHKWNRVIYLKKGKSVDVNSPLAEIISTSEARRRRYKLETNDTLVSIEPRRMKNRGFLKPR